MSKKPFKSQASSSRAFATTFGAQPGSNSIGSFGGSSILGAVPSSLLSYVYEPPDLNAISAPNIVVALKNLQKKDATTKFKALEELQSYVTSAETEIGQLEESIVEAWVKLYPRTSIDSARQVRRLAHLVHGQISALHGKRIAKYLQQVIGCWLAGLYDNDRSVGRAALDSLRQVFPSEEKIRNVWGVYLSSIMQFALDTITKESPSTLSDERTTTPDDSTAKYFRVVGTIICMVTNAIDQLSTNNRIREEPLVQVFLHERKVWDFAADQDAFVRRSVYRLAVAAAKNAKEFLDASLISATLLKKTLPVQNAGSAFDYARALTTLTLEIPEIWSYLEKLSTKKSARQRLCEFLKKGSQAGPPEYWDQIAALIKQLPFEIFTSTSDSKSSEDTVAFSILEALHDGMSNNDEPRANQIPAWNAYLAVAARFISSVSIQAIREDIARQSLVPLVKQYVNPSAGEEKWTIPGSNNEDICVRVVHQIFNASPENLQEIWSQLSHDLIEEIEKQTRERSDDGSNPEAFICARVVRWYSLQSTIFKRFESQFFEKLISEAVIFELEKVFRVLKERSGENISSAVLVESALKMPHGIFRHEEKIMTAILNFAQDEIPRLLLSSSAVHLIQVLTQLTSVIEVNHLCEAGISALRKASESPAKSASLQSFAQSCFLAQENEVDDLKNVIQDYLELALKGNENCWDVVLAALNNPVAPKGLVNSIFAKMTASLAIQDEQLPSLYGLDLVLNRKEQAVKALVGFSGGSHLLSRLLLLAESPSDEISVKARDISVAMEFEVTNEKGPSYAVSSMIEIINDSLGSNESESLSVDSLVQYARRLLEQSNPTERTTVLTALLPSLTQWSMAVVPLMAQTPSSSFSHIAPLGGAIALINPGDHPKKNSNSLAFRIACYTIKLFRSSCPIVLAPQDQVIIIQNLALIYQSATHSSSALKFNLLMENANAGEAPEKYNLFADIDRILTACAQKELEVQSSVMATVQQQLLDDSCDNSLTSYYSACAFLLIENNRKSRESSLGLKAEETEPLRKPSATFQKLVTLKVATDMNLHQKKVNEILADLIGYEFEEQPDTVLPQLVTLNCIISSKKSELISKIPKQRVVLFVKHVVSQVYQRSLSKQITIEVLKSLTVLTVPIKDVYDSFWEQMIDFIDRALSPLNKFLDDDNIPLLHAILELFASLRTLKSEESNEDLEDAWREKEESFLDRLFNLLTECQGVSDDDNVPRHKVNSLLAHLLRGFSHKLSTGLAELYAVLGSESSALQLAAYHILHYQIPNAQGQISVDKALDKEFYAKLPDELLSLIVVAPSPSELNGANLAIYEPHALRSYLLSWKLIFDHWTNSSDKIKVDYATTLKEEPYLQRLLDFAYQTLIRNRPKPFDASALEISSFVPDALKTFNEETYELLVHLYYLSLKHVPSLCRSWWRDTTLRQTALAVETWTEKHICPLILASELQTISDWAPTQSDVDQPMDIKVSPSSREITASIPLDEQFLQISIRLPTSYPLARASVESLRRVAVDEKKWRGWLIATQGIINFTADGGQPIIEGLLAWRRNVTATLKGQTECAICYSVVGSDRQLPSKRCGTCKNLFHGSCLFKWFKSSNSSSCPLCRNAFNYG